MSSTCAITVNDRDYTLNVVKLLSSRIGAGTGIFTRALLAHPEWSSAIGKLTALEPSKGMREQALKTSLKDDPRVSVEEGSFSHTNAEDGQADLVVIAQVCYALR